MNNSWSGELIIVENDSSRIKLIRDEGVFLHLTSDSQVDFELILSRWYFPGWQVVVDNKKQPLHKSKKGLLKIFLTSGTHDT